MRAQFILDAIADKTEVQVGDAELTEYLVRQAARYQMAPQEFANQVIQAGNLPVLVADVRRNKALAERAGVGARSPTRPATRSTCPRWREAPSATADDVDDADDADGDDADDDRAGDDATTAPSRPERTRPGSGRFAPPRFVRVDDITDRRRKVSA